MHGSDRGDEELSAAEVEQVLRRAAELDAAHGASLTASTLRAIAAESGITSSAMERALDEQRAERATRLAARGMGHWQRLRHLLSRPLAALLRPRSLLDVIARNALSALSAWALVWATVQATRYVSLGIDGVRVRWAPEAIGLLLAAGVAERVRARASSVVLLGLGGALGVRFVVEQVSGSWSLAGTAGGVALLFAGVVGVVLGQLLGPNVKQRGMTSANAEPGSQPAGAQSSDSAVAGDGTSPVGVTRLQFALEEPR